LRASAQRIVRERGAIANLERRLRSAGPEETLQRGYAIVTSADGTLVRSMAAARDGERLDLQVVDGMVPVRVELGIRRADAPGPADSLFGT
jgi:exodeoxyribonuclease VII large subunit